MNDDETEDEAEEARARVVLLVGGRWISPAPPPSMELLVDRNDAGRLLTLERKVTMVVE